MEFGTGVIAIGSNCNDPSLLAVLQLLTCGQTRADWPDVDAHNLSHLFRSAGHPCSSELSMHFSMRTIIEWLLFPGATLFEALSKASQPVFSSDSAY